ncbi:MAG: serine/threonine protein kinase [Labilithrix sp.]|nr:serine/threonine protein kinase [Labilithrix sp.]
MGTQGQLRDGERYELLGELASGGMATVYLARMRRPMGFSRLVAIKCMHPQFAKDPSFVSMFMDEARLTARLRHPNIVPTLDIVHEDGHLLLVMEYVEGASLASLLRSASKGGVRVPVPIACAIVHDMLLGLHEAHQAKDDENAPLAIVHRDVSPQNVLVGLDGLARVLDFGVAKARQNTHHSNDNEIKGKIPYMPPEQLFGEAIDHKVDVYAAGVTLWEALVCQRLFDGPSETALVRKISEEPIAKPSSRVADLPPEIDAIVMKALSREAADRYESALAMAEAIAAVVKLPTRTEVSAWVRQYVSPREVPSGSKLPAAEDADPATAMLAVLEKASMLRPSAKRPAPAAPRAASTRTTRFAIGVAALAFAVAGLAVARVAKSEAAVPQIVTTTGAIAPASEASPARVEVASPGVEAPSPAVEAAPAAETASPEPAPVAARLTRPAARAARAAVVPPAPKAPPAAAPAELAAPPAAAPDTKSNCKIPYTIDADGHKHYKVECV